MGKNAKSITRTVRYQLEVFDAVKRIADFKFSGNFSAAQNWINRKAGIVPKKEQPQTQSRLASYA